METEHDVIRSLTEDEEKVYKDLSGKILGKRRINRERGLYHDARRKLDDIGLASRSIPDHVRAGFQMSLGWCEKTVTVPASRIRPDGFSNRTQSTLMDDLNDLTADGQHEAMERSWVRSAMQTGIAFAFVSQGDEPGDEPVRTVAPATRASAIINPRSGEVEAALEKTLDDVDLLYLPGTTLTVTSGGVAYEEVGIPGQVNAEALPWASTLEHPYGRSRITRPLMGLTDTGMRTLLRQEITSEHYSAPQRVLYRLGEQGIEMTKNGRTVSPLEAMIGGVWDIPDEWDEETRENVRAKLEQFSQASMQPHSEMLRSIACLVSSETTIPLGYLGVVHDNPSSAEAILASEADMVAMIEAELAAVGAARARFARKILAVQHGEYSEAMAKDLRTLRGHFKDPGTPTLAARADAGLKFTTTFPDGDPEVAMEIYGLDENQRARMTAYRKRQEGSSLVDKLLNQQQEPQEATDGQQPPAQEPTDQTTETTPAETPPAAQGAADDGLKQAQELKAKFDALGIAIRAGVDPADAANRLGLNGVQFTGAVPVSLRMPTEEAKTLEDG